MKKSRKTISIFILMLLSCSSFAQESEKKQDKEETIAQSLVKQKSDFSKNAIVIPRPNALAVGMMFKTKLNCRLSIGPWVEGGMYSDGPSGSESTSQSLGYLINYTFSEDGAFGTGPTILVIGAFERYKSESPLGSELQVYDKLIGLYGGYQFVHRSGFNAWLGFGYLGIIPLSSDEKLIPNKTPEATDLFSTFSNNRWFPFPGLYLGYSF